jgi:hypothetical protein
LVGALDLVEDRPFAEVALPTTWPWVAAGDVDQVIVSDLTATIAARASELMASGDSRGALAVAEIGISIDWLDEGLLRVAMAAAAAAGDRGRVDELMVDFLDLLDDAGPPEPETVELYRQLQSEVR